MRRGGGRGEGRESSRSSKMALMDNNTVTSGTLNRRSGGDGNDERHRGSNVSSVVLVTLSVLARPTLAACLLRGVSPHCVCHRSASFARSGRPHRPFSRSAPTPPALYDYPPPPTPPPHQQHRRLRPSAVATITTVHHSHSSASLLLEPLSVPPSYQLIPNSITANGDYGPPTSNLLLLLTRLSAPEANYHHGFLAAILWWRCSFLSVHRHPPFDPGAF